MIRNIKQHEFQYCLPKEGIRDPFTQTNMQNAWRFVWGKTPLEMYYCHGERAFRNAFYDFIQGLRCTEICMRHGVLDVSNIPATIQYNFRRLMQYLFSLGYNLFIGFLDTRNEILYRYDYYPYNSDFIPFAQLSDEDLEDGNFEEAPVPFHPPPPLPIHSPLSPIPPPSESFSPQRDRSRYNFRKHPKSNEDDDYYYY